MAQNIKIILDNVKNEVPNNINFNDTITIKGGSKIALTSFNASFDINSQGRFLQNQSFVFYPNFETTHNLEPITITLPSQIYYHQTELDNMMYKIINNALSAYLENNVGNEEALIGKTFSLNLSEKKTIFSLDTIELEPFSYTSPAEFTVDENGFYTTLNEELELNLSLPNNLTTPSSLLMKGGGVCYQYAETFNFSNTDLNSYMELSDNKGDYMRLYYRVVKVGSVNPLTNETVTNKTMLFYVSIKKNNVITNTPIRNDFYDWASFNETGSTGVSGQNGPWSNDQIGKNNYFMWYQKNGRWGIVYGDNNLNKYESVFENGLEWDINSNYKFNKYIQQASTTNCKFNANFNQATFTKKISGNASISSKFEFNNCPELIEIYGFGNTGLFIPINNPSSSYTPNTETVFYPIDNFELACEIDTIKIKNFVGTGNGSQVGRRNIISYFTPETSIAQTDLIYRFDPSNPIYLAVDSSSDINLNSINIRFFNTYTNKGFVCNTLSCVLTNI